MQIVPKLQAHRRLKILVMRGQPHVLVNGEHEQIAGRVENRIELRALYAGGSFMPTHVRDVEVNPAQTDAIPCLIQLGRGPTDHLQHRTVLRPKPTLEIPRLQLIHPVIFRGRQVLQNVMNRHLGQIRFRIPQRPEKGRIRIGEMTVRTEQENQVVRIVEDVPVPMFALPQFLLSELQIRDVPCDHHSPQSLALVGAQRGDRHQHAEFFARSPHAGHFPDEIILGFEFVQNGFCFIWIRQESLKTEGFCFLRGPTKLHRRRVVELQQPAIFIKSRNHVD